MIIFDPKFMQSLGKAMGWREEVYSNYAKIRQAPPKIEKFPEWLERWHKLIDYLAEDL